MAQWVLLVSCTVAVICAVGIAPRAAGAESGTPVAAAADGTQTCPECGYENEAGVNFCIMCGAPLQGETPAGKVYCPQCGAENREDSDFCTTCGYPLHGEKPGVGAAAPRSAVGVYFTGGLASYGDTELTYEGVSYPLETGSSWAAGGGVAIPLMTRPGAAQLSLELSTDVYYSKIDKVYGGDFEGLGLNMSYIPVREAAILGVGFGPGGLIKPFCGFGAGVAIFKWKFEYAPEAYTLDEGTNVKPVFGIPLGCEFRLARHFAVGFRADYLIIPGDVESVWDLGWYEFIVNAAAPDVLLVGGTARLDF